MKKYHLSMYEQETVINYNRESKFAQVYSADPIVLRKLDALCERFPEVYVLLEEESMNGEIIGKTYRVPKRMVRFGIPRILTESQQQTLSDRLRRIRDGSYVPKDHSEDISYDAFLHARQDASS